MRRTLTFVFSLALIAGGVALGEPVSAGGIDSSRNSARTVRNQRTGPELSDLDAEEPVDEDDSWDDYARERADYYRVKREGEERKHRTGGKGACMYGPDGSVIYAPAGRQCGPAAPPQ